MRKQVFFRQSAVFILFICNVIFIPHVKAQTSSEIETPEKHFGYKPGADRMLFDYEELIAYLQKLDTASSRLKLVEIGESPMGKTMYIAFISSEENIGNLDNLKQINRRLALDPNIPDIERESLIKDGKVFFIATLSMHSDEVGPSQSAPLIAYDLVTTDNPQKKEWLDNVVYMMVPCHNPDGMDMVVNHYKKYKGTKFEGSWMPGIYHKYVGHDNNRDFLALTQEDNKAIARIFSRDWFPQVMVSKHQMMLEGIRYFVPPVHDPISENIDAGVWNWRKIFGSNMMKDMTEEGHAGVAQHNLFDDYAPIYSNVCMWKNVISFLTEAASVLDATPVFVEANELKAYGKGLSDYKKSINMPLPWPGGWWRLADIVEYEISSTMSIIKTASLHREDILKFNNDLCRREVLKGKTEPPYYYILPLKQHDKSAFVSLVNLLKEHGVNVYHLTKPATLGDKTFDQGDVVVPLAQPFRPFIKDTMEKQKYPVRHYTPGGEIIKPYDVTSWSLPLHRGVKAYEIVDAHSEIFESKFEEIKEPYALKKESPEDFQIVIFSANNNESFKAAFLALKLGLKVGRLQKAMNVDSEQAPKGSFVIHSDEVKSTKIEQLIKEMTVSPIFVKDAQETEAVQMTMPRIALVETYFHDMDAGWSRYIFDTYYIPYKVVRPGDFAKTDFSKDFDVVVFPDAEKSVLMSGKEKYGEQTYISNYPPEYTKGIDKDGMVRLMSFLDKGGIIVSWNQSTELFQGTLEIELGKDKKEEFQLPFRDISKDLQKSGLYCPGSLLSIKLTKDHPITLGMPDEVGIFFEGKPVFSTSIPSFDMDRRVIGKFPEDNILLSGYCEKEETLSYKTCLVWLKKGKAQLVLFGFNPQYRAIVNVSFKLLFNSLLLPKIKE